MANLPSRDIVAANLPEMAEFRPAILEGWKRWATRDPAEKLVITDTVRAGMVHCFCIDEMQKRLGERARVFRLSELVVFVIGEYAIRVKKHDANLKSRNQETNQVKAFMGQECLDGIPAIGNLELGYVLDASGSELKETNLVCPNGYRNSPFWRIELHNEGYAFGDDSDLLANAANENDADGDIEKKSRWVKRESGIVVPFENHKLDKK